LKKGYFFVLSDTINYPKFTKKSQRVVNKGPKKTWEEV